MKTLNVAERSLLASRYARGLFESCKKPERVVEIAEELAELNHTIESNRELKETLLNPILSGREKLSVIVLLHPETDDLVLRLLLILFERDRLKLLPFLARKFGRIAENERGLTTVTAVLAHDIDASERGRIANKIGIWLRTEAQVSFVVDPSIIGGLKLQVGDRIYDGSVLRSLAVARKTLVE